MNTFLGLLAAGALILLIALPALIGFGIELRISRQIRAARAAERRREEQSSPSRVPAEATRGAFSPVV
ncbi:hypothetical protein [Streptomyces sp. RKAG293]|uniref:hypothetical protein n=1 Tax=Streptomyces sp. RKAG293 TaxID=2893403 RepID=UPI0020338D0C|nr:hypothetical protein [Streptomyces sp. RKAG293]MCM2421527.1 hypothetical protein [Streptomyces sp. RKAG293]